MNQFLIVCPLLFLAGFLDAIGGGGGLISLPAYLLAGLPVHSAIATNKLSGSCGTAHADQASIFVQPGSPQDVPVSGYCHLILRGNCPT